MIDLNEKLTELNDAAIDAGLVYKGFLEGSTKIELGLYGLFLTYVPECDFPYQLWINEFGKDSEMACSKFAHELMEETEKELDRIREDEEEDEEPEDDRFNECDDDQQVGHYEVYGADRDIPQY